MKKVIIVLLVAGFCLWGCAISDCSEFTKVLEEYQEAIDLHSHTCANLGYTYALTGKTREELHADLDEIIKDEQGEEGNP